MCNIYIYIYLACPLAAAMSDSEDLERPAKIARSAAYMGPRLAGHWTGGRVVFTLTVLEFWGQVKMAAIHMMRKEGEGEGGGGVGIIHAKYVLFRILKRFLLQVFWLNQHVKV